MNNNSVLCEVVYSLHQTELRRFLDDFFATECSSHSTLQVLPPAPAPDNPRVITQLVKITTSSPCCSRVLNDALREGILFYRWDNHRVDDILQKMKVRHSTSM